MERYIFREAKLKDVPQIERILDDAVARMLAEGKKQWNENYPTAIHVLADLNRHAGYVIERDGRICAYGAVIFSGEPAYEEIRGEWLTEGPYVVVHRLAVALHAQRQGIASRFFKAVESLAASEGAGAFRVDTNFDNDRMLRLLATLGFERCGEISYEGGARIAFEKII